MKNLFDATTYEIALEFGKDKSHSKLTQLAKTAKGRLSTCDLSDLANDVTEH